MRACCTNIPIRHNLSKSVTFNEIILNGTSIFMYSIEYAAQLLPISMSLLTVISSIELDTHENHLKKKTPTTIQQYRHCTPPTFEATTQNAFPLCMYCCVCVCGYRPIYGFTKSESQYDVGIT